MHFAITGKTAAEATKVVGLIVYAPVNYVSLNSNRASLSNITIAFFDHVERTMQTMVHYTLWGKRLSDLGKRFASMKTGHLLGY